MSRTAEFQSGADSSRATTIPAPGTQDSGDSNRSSSSLFELAHAMSE